MSGDRVILEKQKKLLFLSFECVLKTLLELTWRLLFASSEFNSCDTSIIPLRRERLRFLRGPHYFTLGDFNGSVRPQLAEHRVLLFLLQEKKRNFPGLGPSPTNLRERLTGKPH